jgi:hypothetical protein
MQSGYQAIASACCSPNSLSLSSSLLLTHPRRVISSHSHDTIPPNDQLSRGWLKYCRPLCSRSWSICPAMVALIACWTIPQAKRQKSFGAVLLSYQRLVTLHGMKSDLRNDLIVNTVRAKLSLGRRTVVTSESSAHQCLYPSVHQTFLLRRQVQPAERDSSVQ